MLREKNFYSIFTMYRNERNKTFFYDFFPLKHSFDSHFTCCEHNHTIKKQQNKVFTFKRILDKENTFSSM